jgi:hypothetical protein
LGNFWNRFQNSDFFCGFPQCTGFEILDFSAVSRHFQGTQKNLKTRIFLQWLGILKDWLVQKILVVFPAMNKAQNLDFPAVSHNFLGTRKILETWFSRVFLGFQRTGSSKIFWNSDHSFLGILKCWTNPKKLVNPQTYPRFFLGIQSDGPTQKSSKPVNFTGPRTRQP